MGQPLYPLARAFALCWLLSPYVSTQAQPIQPVAHPAPASPVAEAPAHSCRELAARSSDYRDGNYDLQVQGRRVPLYCHDMAGVPREYLELPEGNCSAYAAGQQSTMRQVQTCFQKVRLDPETLRVDIGDLTFAQTLRTGILMHDEQVVEAMPYATAMACDAPGVPTGKASITLTGTGFAVVDSFKAQGFKAQGEARQQGRGQKWELQGGGYCGWIAPSDVYNPHYATRWNPFKPGTGFLLQLRTVSDRQQRGPLDKQKRLVDDGQKRGPVGQQCYWMENYSGQYQWVPADPVYGKVLSKKECRALDSCNGGGGQSNGGCYKWADAADAEVAVQPPEEQACRQKGGDWIPQGMLGKNRCVLKASDAGKYCSDGSQCQSNRCLYNEGFRLPGTHWMGKCAANDSHFGCYQLVQNRNVTPALCVD